MSIRKQVPMTVNRLPHGVFQWTLSFDPDRIEADQFRAEGLELPLNLQHAIKKRQIEFLCGRLCAKACMEDLGYEAPPLIPSDGDRAPVWPPKVLGSISHTDRFATAVVGPASRIEAIGIDVERVIAEASPQLIKHICIDPDELDAVQEAQGISKEEALTLIFSGKESLYKAVHPKLRRFFGFQAARVTASEGRRLKISLVTDLSAAFARGAGWDLQISRPSPDLIETLVLQAKL